MATAALIDGKAFAEGLRKRIAAEVARLKKAHGFVPGLAVVLVGDDPASHVYVRNKTKAANEAGIAVTDHKLPATASEADVLALVRRLNADGAVDGILVQLPLPVHIAANGGSDTVLRAIDPAKDADGFHPVNVGLLGSGQMQDALVPCTPLGCMLLLKDRAKKQSGGDLSGRHAVVLGRSNIVGRPMAQLLLQANCTVTVVHSRTRDLAAHCRRADILVAAIGKPEFVSADMIAPGAVVIDVGINRVPGEGGKTRLLGDVAFADARRVASAITPVPGGVGPMTIAFLLANTVKAACRRRGLPAHDWSGV
jgi:methylenetetrahydrofolate dehydrogenase (NADP+) / methenyltetrahydrofolate cyclohydrolase